MMPVKIPLKIEDEYLLFLNYLLDAYAEGHVPLQFVEDATLEAVHGEKNGYLAYCYQKPVVDRFHARAQEILPKESSLQSVLEKRRKGDLRKYVLMEYDLTNKSVPEFIYDDEYIERERVKEFYKKEMEERGVFDESSVARFKKEHAKQKTITLLLPYISLALASALYSPVAFSQQGAGAINECQTPSTDFDNAF